MQIRNSIFHKCWQHAFAVPTPTHLYPLVLNPTSMMLQGNCGSMRIWTKPCTEKTQLWHWWRSERDCHWRRGLAWKRYRSSISSGHAVNIVIVFGFAAASSVMMVGEGLPSFDEKESIQQSWSSYYLQRSSYNSKMDLSLSHLCCEESIQFTKVT
jgi:hypothetical protein